jgi:hypothetical protein
MFGNLQLQIFQVEAVLPDYLLRGGIKPLGPLLTYVNDRSRGAVRFEDLELLPLPIDRQVGCIKQPKVTVDKANLVLLSVVKAEDAATVQLLQSKRPVVFYTSHFAIQGDLHVNQDSRDDDLLDDSRDFSALSDALIFPLRQLGVTPTRKTPLLLVNHHHIQTYHTR